MTKKSCPERLTEHFGDMPSAAAALSKHAEKVNPRVKGLRKQTVMWWIIKGFIPEMYALGVEQLTEGAITAAEIVEEAGRARRSASMR